jgi:hypothetical protein
VAWVSHHNGEIGEGEDVVRVVGHVSFTRVFDTDARHGRHVGNVVLEMSGWAENASGSVDLNHSHNVLGVHVQIGEGVTRRANMDSIGIGTHIDRRGDTVG